MLFYFLILLYSRIIAAQKINLRLTFHATFQTFSDMGCRTKYSAKGFEGIEYDLYLQETIDTCKSKCLSRGDGCFGFEYGTLSSDQGRCEIWKRPIDEYRLEYVHGLNCYIKDPPTPAPTVSHVPTYDMSIGPTSSPVPTTTTRPPFGICSQAGKRRCCRYVYH